MSTPTEVPLTCSLLNSDQPRGAIYLYRSMTPLCFPDFDVISVTTEKKSLLGKVSLNFLHEIIVNNLLSGST